MKLADTLAYGMSAMPLWMGKTLLRMNFLREYMFGPAMHRFKQTIPTIDPEEKIVAMANYAIKHVPYYRERYAGLTVRSAADFEREFDFIDKSTIQADPTKFVSDIAANYKEVSTSGSTGVPLKLLIPANRHITEMAFVTRAWQQAGWNFGPRVRIRIGEMPPGRDYMVNPFTKEFIFDAALPSDDYVRKIHSVMKRNRLDTLYSYSMQGYVLLKRFQALGLDTSIVRRALLTSEPVTEMQYDFIHNELGIEISSFYGHTEKLIFARSLNGLDSFVVEPGYGYFELIDDNGTVLRNEGDSGEMVGSTFYNFAMPLLRYRTGDNATLGAPITDFDGVRKPLLAKLEGRSKVGVKRIDGTIISQSNITFHGPELAHLEGLQIVQNRPGYIKVLYKPAPQFTAADYEAIRTRATSQMLGDEYVEMVPTDEFILTKAGKFLLFVNQCR